MEKFCIMSDSCCDFTPEMAEELQIEILPLSVHFGTETYRNWLDGREITLEVFYQRIRNGELPTTSGVSVGDFEEKMYQHLHQNEDILCLCFSSGLSSTYQSARIAASHLKDKFPSRVIKVIDSLMASGGHGLLVYRCAMMRNSGKTIEEVYQYAEKLKQNICGWFTVDDLNHLKRGGRISTTAAFFGNMLSLKPIIHIDDAGKLAAVEKVRGRRNSLLRLIDHMLTSGIELENQDIFITHADCLWDAEYISEEITRRVKTGEIHLSYVGPVIGTHTGPGLVTLFFLGDRR